MKFKLIVAVCKGGGIGINSTLPWSIKEDLKYFSKVTKGNGNNAIIMGRKTFESIGSKSLPKRDNLILTRSEIKNNDDLCGNIFYFNSIKSIQIFCENKKYDEAWIIGGEEIYKLFLNNNLIDMCSITYINHKFHCDTFFPKFGKEWLMKEYYKLDNQKNYDVNIVTIVRNDN